MKNGLKWIIGLLVLVFGIAGASLLYKQLGDRYTPDKLANETPKSTQAQKKDNKAPDFTVIDNNSDKVKLSDMHGKPVVVNFWASWCPPCKAEMPDFEEMYKKYGTEISFMMVNMTDGQQETLEKAKAHIAENKYTFPVYFDTEFSAAITYRVASLPTTYFIDAGGNIVTYANGMIDYQTLEKGIGMIKHK